jgi:hypothetical protein
MSHAVAQLAIEAIRALVATAAGVEWLIDWHEGAAQLEPI